MRLARDGVDGGTGIVTAGYSDPTSTDNPLMYILQRNKISSFTLQLQVLTVIAM